MVEFDHSIPAPSQLGSARRLVFVLGDQLDSNAPTLKALDPRRDAVLMVEDGAPVGGHWNFDRQNREAFDREPDLRRPYRARPDATTREVMRQVEQRFPNAPGKMEHLHWPVTAPNVIGMSQHADGGGRGGPDPTSAAAVTSNACPNYCEGCRYEPTRRTGENACPFTVLYWNFLLRHRRRFEENHRMGMMMKNVERLESAERREIRRQAESIRRRIEVG